MLKREVWSGVTQLCYIIGWGSLETCGRLKLLFPGFRERLASLACALLQPSDIIPTYASTITAFLSLTLIVLLLLFIRLTTLSHWIFLPYLHLHFFNFQNHTWKVLKIDIFQILRVRKCNIFESPPLPQLVFSPEFQTYCSPNVHFAFTKMFSFQGSSTESINLTAMHLMNWVESVTINWICWWSACLIIHTKHSLRVITFIKCGFLPTAFTLCLFGSKCWYFW